MSAADIQLKINELEADIIDIKGSNEFSFKEKVQYIDRKDQRIIILENKIEKLTPAVIPVIVQALGVLSTVFLFPSMVTNDFRACEAKSDTVTPRLKFEACMKDKYAPSTPQDISILRDRLSSLTDADGFVLLQYRLQALVSVLQSIRTDSVTGPELLEWSRRQSPMVPFMFPLFIRYCVVNLPVPMTAFLLLFSTFLRQDQLMTPTNPNLLQFSSILLI